MLHRHGRRGILFSSSATDGHALRKVRPRYHRLDKVRRIFGKGGKIKHLILVLGLALCSHLVSNLATRDNIKVRSADSEDSRWPTAN